MLLNRAISRCLRKTCPELFAGLYTKEELLTVEEKKDINQLNNASQNLLSIKNQIENKKDIIESENDENPSIVLKNKAIQYAYAKGHVHGKDFFDNDFKKEIKILEQNEFGLTSEQYEAQIKYIDDYIDKKLEGQNNEN